MAFLITSALAFVINILVLITVSRRTMRRSNSLLLALLAAAAVGAIVSISTDFSLTYAVPDYDRSFPAVVERAAMGAALGAVVGWLAARSLKNSRPF